MRSAVLPRIRPDKSCRGPPLAATVLAWSLACIRVSEKLFAKSIRDGIKRALYVNQRRNYCLFIFDALTGRFPHLLSLPRVRKLRSSTALAPVFFLPHFFFYTPTIFTITVSDFYICASHRTSFLLLIVFKLYAKRLSCSNIFRGLLQIII